MKTFLKAKCRKTGKWFGLEVEKNGTSPAVITNFVDIKNDIDKYVVDLVSADASMDLSIAKQFIKNLLK